MICFFYFEYTKSTRERLLNLILLLKLFLKLTYDNLDRLTILGIQFLIMHFNINRETQLCMSVSARPSNFGTHFHNYLYEHLNLNYIYKAFQIEDIKGAINGIRALKIRGCAVSMPFKEECIPFLDELDASAKALQSVNTIVNTNGHLKAYNTDYLAVRSLLESNHIDPKIPFILKGSGGMAKAVAGALFDAGFKNGIIVARNAQKRQALADLYHYKSSMLEAYTAQSNSKATNHTMLINVTPIGMLGGIEADHLAFSENEIKNASVIFDVVALPIETPLIKKARELNKQIICGADVMIIQAVEQFVLYTGIRPSEKLIEQAANFARTK